MSFITYDEFATRVRAVAFPEGEAENRVAVHDSYIKEALVNLQTFVPCLRDNNVNFYEKSDVQEWCNADFLTIPRGVIHAVYAFDPDRYCRRYFYDARTIDFINCWMESQKCVTCETESEDNDISENPNCNDLVYGNEPCEDETYAQNDENTCSFLNGPRYYAKSPLQKLYLAPRFPCGYRIAVHWEGIKQSYDGTEPLPDDEDLISAVAKYVLGQFALFADRDTTLYDRIMDKRLGEFTTARADLIHRCTRERRIQARRECMSGFDVLSPFVTDPFQTADESGESGGVPVPPGIFSVTYFGAFFDPNGNQTGKPGDWYKSVESLGGDGSVWVKQTGNNTTTGWI